MRIIKLVAVMSVVPLFATAAVSADVIAYWAENNNALSGGGFGFEDGDFPQAADYGAQTGSATLMPGGGDILQLGVDTVYDWIQSFAGTTVNAQFGEPSGGSFSFQGGAETVNNGAYLDFEFDGTDWQDVTFSFAGRRTSTGFNDVDIDVYDGATFLGNLVSDLNLNPSGFEPTPYSYDASLLDGVTNARIRMTFNGATSSSGNFRLDNMLIEGTPEPASLVLFGLGTAAFLRRRRA